MGRGKERSKPANKVKKERLTDREKVARLNNVLKGIAALAFGFMLISGWYYLRTSEQMARVEATSYAGIAATATARGLDPLHSPAELFATEAASQLPGAPDVYESAARMYLQSGNACSAMGVEQTTIETDGGPKEVAVFLTTYHCIEDQDGILKPGDVFLAGNADAILGETKQAGILVLGTRIVDNPRAPENEPQALVAGMLIDSENEAAMPRPLGVDNLGCGPILAGATLVYVGFPSVEKGGESVPSIIKGVVEEIKKPDLAKVRLGMVGGASGGAVFDVEAGCAAGLLVTLNSTGTNDTPLIPLEIRSLVPGLMEDAIRLTQSLFENPNP